MNDGQLARQENREPHPGSAPTSPPSPEDIALQDTLLPGVSRTFALTIPQLPEQLRVPVTNAYLLCRIADTIEDEPALEPAEKQRFHQMFVAALRGEASASEFARELHPKLSAATLEAERELILHSPEVLHTTRALPVTQRAALERCVSIMCEGMPQFQNTEALNGLASLREMERYCYFVAGVVGEMLTELFCDYSPEIELRRDELMGLAIAFGQGLQMTNILKDIWEDRDRDACWLPRDVFDEAGVDISTLRSKQASGGFNEALNELIGVAHACLRNALRYTQLIPSAETGIRRFCLWAIGMAVLTLRKIHQNPDFSEGQAVKISRRAVRTTIFTANLTARSNSALDVVFALAARGLPLADRQRYEALTSGLNG
ncbi:MAG: phytoene/squalene synthase family protein [Gammaproteobacteria bacterium]|nr:phytoene/squalene synthase family protein [Gammaproteobacteria bacterium]